MLVLMRQAGQVIEIGPDIKITVCKFGHRDGRPRVSIGIDAPDDVPIVRPDAIDKCPKDRRGKRDA